MFVKPDQENERPRRVLMTADAVGGVWRYALDLSRGLSHYGIEVLLAVMGPLPNVEQRIEAAAISNLDLVARDFPLEWREDVSDQELNESGQWLRSLAADFQPDVVHLNGYSHAAQHWKAPVLVVAHSCVYSWWAAVHRRRPPHSWKPYRKRVMRGLAAAASVVTPSSSMLEALRRSYGMPLLEGGVIHNWADIQEGHAPVKQPMVLGCGRLWDEAKNFRVLDQAASRLPWPVVLAGDASHAQRNSFQFSSVRLTGLKARRDMLDLLAEASIFAHPSKYEPFGLAVLEAARKRCALVLADIPSLRGLWSDSAVFVPPDDPGAWTAALNTFITDPDLRESYADRAFRQSSCYSAKASTSLYVRHYQHLMWLHREPRPKLRDEVTDQTLLPLHRL